LKHAYKLRLRTSFDIRVWWRVRFDCLSFAARTRAAFACIALPFAFGAAGMNEHQCSWLPKLAKANGCTGGSE